MTAGGTLRAGLVVAAIAAASAAPASAARLRLHRVATAIGPAIASGTSSMYAYRDTATSLVVRTPGSAGRAYAVPANCTTDAITTGRVALTCSIDNLSNPAVLDLATASITPVNVMTSDTFAYERTEAIGSHWLRVVASANLFSDDPHAEAVLGLVEQATGLTVSLGADDPYPVRDYLDLDRENPARPLCAPVTRRHLDGLRNETRYETVTDIDRWVLQNDDLQRCGARAFKHFAAGSHPTLGRRALAYLRRTRREIVYEDLVSGRLWSAPWPAKSRGPTAQMAGGRLIVSAPAAGVGAYTIYETSRDTTHRTS